MTFEIEVDGRSRAVAVEPVEKGRFRVTVDGRPHLVDAARAGEFGLSLLVSNLVSNDDEGAGVASRDVQVVPAGSQGSLIVVLEGRTVGVTVNGRRFRRGGADASVSGGGELSVAAPMPGRVVRVLVGAGEQVTARQPVVVVEAMKMENELRAPRAGVVKEVAVAAGVSVEAGRVLVTIA